MDWVSAGHKGGSLGLPLAFLASLGLLAAWLLPNHYFPWVTAYQEFSVFLAALLLWSLCVWRGFYLPAIALLFVALAFVPLLQWALGLLLFFGDAFMASVYLLGFAIALGLGESLSSSVERQQRLVSVLAMLLIFAGCLSVWIAFRQWMMMPGSSWFADLGPGARPFANFAQPNNLAIFLCMGLAGVLYFIETRRLGGWSSGLLAAFLIFGVALTESRTPWIVALVVCVFWFFKGRSIAVRLPPRALLAWVCFYAVLVMALPWIAELLLLHANDPLMRAQAMHRLDLWQQLAFAVLQGPWWGYGWNQVSIAQVSVSAQMPVELMTEHSHNILLDVLLWNGPWLGALLIILVGAWFVWLLAKVTRPEAVFAALVALCLLVHGLLEYPLEYAFFLLPMGVLLGATALPGLEKWRLYIPRVPAILLLAASWGLFAWVWQEYRVIEEDSRLMRFETAGIGFLAAEQAAPDVVLLTQLREFTRFARTQASEGMSQEQLDWMGKVARRYPYPPSLFRYALALGLNDQPEAARQQLVILKALHPEEHYAQALENLVLMQAQYPVLEQLRADAETGQN